MNNGLAKYAAHDDRSRGRQYKEPDPAYRRAFQRDRDRIIHSAAFRRLEYKTQVFVNHEGDMYRTRLTHSLEVAQLARTIARALRLNEDLSEAIALAHDLGHTPFGHSGQDALNDCMKDYGGFEHNLQSLRVIDELEEKYAAFPGLNLSFEAREGILKHCAPKRAKKLGAVGARFLNGGQPGLEAQLVNLADEIAYNNHDVDDGLRAGLLDIDGLRAIELFREQHDIVIQRWPDIGPRTVVHEVIRHMINVVVSDLIQTSSDLLQRHDPADIDAVRASDTGLIALSPAMREKHLQLKRFLRKQLYQHPQVTRMTHEATVIVRDLFSVFMDSPAMSEQGHSVSDDGDTRRKARLVADYIAGMTDRFAIAEHKRLCEQT